jgi:hypothetical protein
MLEGGEGSVLLLLVVREEKPLPDPGPDPLVVVVDGRGEACGVGRCLATVEKRR